MRTLCIILLLLINNILAGVIFVPKQHTMIQSAINYAYTGDTVVVMDGIYYENINFIGKAITVSSHFLIDHDSSHISNTIIDGSKASNPDSGSVVYFISGEDTFSVLEGLTLRGGSGTFTYRFPFNQVKAGGAIHIYKSGATIRNNIIKDNLIDYIDESEGAAICTMPYTMCTYIIVENNRIINNNSFGYYNGWAGAVSLSCSGRISNNTFYQNKASSKLHWAIGGALCIYSDFSNQFKAEITENIFRDNSAVTNGTAYGGALFIHKSDISLCRNHLINNRLITTGHGFGGAIYIERVYNPGCIYANYFCGNGQLNSLYHGGAIYICKGKTLVYSNIFTKNKAGFGGAIEEYEGNSIQINNTMVSNTSRHQGAAIYYSYCEYPFLMNNIIWGNTSFDSLQIYAHKSKMDILCNNIQGNEYEQNFDFNPGFSDSSTFILSDSSKCIGKGRSIGEVNFRTFQAPLLCYNRKLSRPSPSNSNPDLGAFESPLSQPVGITTQKMVQDFPFCFELFQNYPNPFNPVTNIEYQIQKRMYINISVYNTAGKKIVTLVSQIQPAGNYKVTWDASGFSSGIYFYKLENDQGFSRVLKLVVLK